MGKKNEETRRVKPADSDAKSRAGKPRSKNLATLPAAKSVSRAKKREGREPPPPNESRTIRTQPRAADAWRDLAFELSVALEALEEDEFLILSAKKSNRFVQFSGQGSFGMRVEAVSDYYLPEEIHLSEVQVANLLELGWRGPTNLPDELEPGRLNPDGSPNYFLDLAKPVPYDLLATLAVATLTNVYGIGHPGQLQYKAFSADGGSVRFPHLGLSRRLT